MAVTHYRCSRVPALPSSMAGGPRGTQTVSLFVFWRLQQAKGEKSPPTTPQSPHTPLLLPGTGAGGLRLWGPSGLSLFGALGSHHVTWAVYVVLT